VRSVVARPKLQDLSRDNHQIFPDTPSVIIKKTLTG